MAKYGIYKCVGSKKTLLSSYNTKLEGIDGLKKLLLEVGDDYSLEPDESLWRVNSTFRLIAPSRRIIYILSNKPL